MTSYLSNSDVNTNIVEGDEETQSLLDKPNTRSSKRRWLILILGSSFTFINGVQNLQFAGSADATTYFFQTEDWMTDMLTQAYYLSFSIFAFLVIWIIIKKGLQFAARLTSFLCFLGSVLALISTSSQNLFPVALTSQFTAGIAQIFVFSIPSMLAGAWFPTNEVSTAIGIIIFMYQFGNGMALLIPPLVMSHVDGNSTLSGGMVLFFATLAGFATITFIAVLKFFEEKPRNLQNLEDTPIDNVPQTSSLFQSLKNLTKDINFLKLQLSYGITQGIFNTEQTLLEALIAKECPELSEITLGQIAAATILTGTLAPVVLGVILDRTKKYKLTIMLVQTACVCSILTITIALKYHILWLVWLGSIMLGLSFTGNLSISIDTSAEITYPEHESASSGILSWTSSIFSVIFIQIVRALLKISTLYAGIFIASAVTISLLLQSQIRFDLKRTNADNTV